MDGYSVEEAAEVLGVSQGRVWELIARGVLVGASEGRADMRVFLRPATPPQRFEADPPLPRPPGNGGTHVEASPFRELLTEFRNLTERYGQALLALGEARGEVAALRSRVDLLEARMDMRLPMRPASTVAWELSERRATAEAGSEAPETESAAAATGVPADVPAEPAVAAATTPGAEVMPEPEPESVLEPPPLQEATAPEVTGTSAESAGDAEAPAVVEPPGVTPEPAPTQAAAEELTAEPAPTKAAEEVPVRVDLPEPAAKPAGVEPVERPEPKRRITGGRAAVAGLAEALARAEDPTLADLPGAREAAAAMAAFQRSVRTEEGPEAAPTEIAPAEPTEPPARAPAPVDAAPEPEVAAEPTPEPSPMAAPTADSPYTTEVVEPDWFADGDFNWLDAGQAEVAVEGPSVGEEPGEQPAEAEHLDREDETPTAEAIQDAFAEPAPEPAAGQSDEMMYREPEEAPSASVASEEAPAEPISDARPPSEASAEAEHVAREDEWPSAEAIQDAFTEPPAEPETVERAEAEDAEVGDEPQAFAAADESSAQPATDAQPVREATSEVEHVAREDEWPSAEAIQDAFAEHDAPSAERTASDAAWPREDRAGITDSGTVGFGLFRGQATSASAPGSPGQPAEPAEDEEPLLWFGDEFEAAQLEVAAQGWRDQEHAPSPPSREPTVSGAPAMPVSEADLARIAADEGWDREEVDAIRSYLDRTSGKVADEAPHADDAFEGFPGPARSGEPEPAFAETGAEAPIQPAPVQQAPLQKAPTRPAPSSPGHSPDQDWLRGRRGTAAGAYRRLRRLFNS